MAGRITSALLSAAKNYLNITWSDTATDDKVRELLNSGMVYLDTKAGAVNDYAEFGEPRTLLLEYARYARDEALEVFEENFRPRILAMQNRRRVNAYETPVSGE